MNSLELDPPRWKDRAGQANLAERMAGRLIRAMGQPPVLSDPQLARIQAAACERQRRASLVRWWPAMAAALLVSGATFAVAAHLDLVPRWLRPAPAPQAPAPSARSHKPHLSRGTFPSISAPEQAAPAPAIETPPEIHAPAEVAPSAPVQVPTRKPAANLAFVKTPDAVRVPPLENRRQEAKARATPADWNAASAARPAEPLVVPPPAANMRVTTTPTPAPSAPAPTETMRATVSPAPSPPLPAARLAMVERQPQPMASVAVGHKSGERWLAKALHSLRSDHAPAAALALLDSHAAELGQSALVHEVMLLRVEALLDLKRSGEALALLDGKALSNVAASRTLLLTRAQLRAAAGRCADGLADFDLLLARARRPDEQALYGRAVCRSRTGDKRGAQADFRFYQRQFPNGAHIRDVQEQLAGAQQSAVPVP
jgi:hypothetical protein